MESPNVPSFGQPCLGVLSLWVPAIRGDTALSPNSQTAIGEATGQQLATGQHLPWWWIGGIRGDDGEEAGSGEALISGGGRKSPLLPIDWKVNENNHSLSGFRFRTSAGCWLAGGGCQLVSWSMNLWIRWPCGWISNYRLLAGRSLGFHFLPPSTKGFFVGMALFVSQEVICTFSKCSRLAGFCKWSNSLPLFSPAQLTCSALDQQESLQSHSLIRRKKSKLRTLSFPSIYDRKSCSKC